jgi:nucleotide-binding universal stress UspA family protein
MFPGAVRGNRSAGSDCTLSRVKCMLAVEIRERSGRFNRSRLTRPQPLGGCLSRCASRHRLRCEASPYRPRSVEAPRKGSRSLRLIHESKDEREGDGRPKPGRVVNNMKIILAIDDLKSSEAAMQAVITRARPQDTEILVLHVVEPPSLMVARQMRSHNPDLKALWQETEQQAQAMVRSAAQRLRSKGLSASSVVVKGDPKSRIIDVAAKQEADLIVLGSHGRKGVDRFLMGSVSEAVARYAACSVEIARIRPVR